MLEPVNFTEALATVELILLAGEIPLLVGPPGCGKSALYALLAKDYNLFLIDLRVTDMEPPDFAGYPMPNADRTRASYIPFDTFPLEGDPIPAGFDGFLVLLDEFPSGDRNTLKACYKLLHDRKIGQRKLHPKLFLACAGNRMEDNAIVEEIGTALQSRLVHVEMRSDPKIWLDYAASQNFDYRITAYINWDGAKLNQFDPDHSDKTFACERTWEKCSKILKQNPDPSDKIVQTALAGAISAGAAADFITYSRVFATLPSLDLIERDPLSPATPVPTEPGTLYALMGAIASRATKDNADPLIQYLVRVPMPFQVACLRDMVKRKPETATCKEAARWIAVNNKELY
jgi:hypothetical protein